MLCRGKGRQEEQMKRKKSRLTLQDWGRIPSVAPKSTPGYETLRQFQEREGREEQERREGPIRKLETTLNSALRENATNVAAFYSRSIEKLLNSSTSSSPVDFGLGSFPGSE